ncbi:hypothetical protein [Cryptosporangium japonicum]|uniref:Uncharacterized protein n=1 Tax=Cryptosporangium japonicum TaxID=80872 RepID=A0ABN0V2Q9_9ACTN
MAAPPALLTLAALLGLLVGGVAVPAVGRADPVDVEVSVTTTREVTRIRTTTVSAGRLTVSTVRSVLVVQPPAIGLAGVPTQGNGNGNGEGKAEKAEEKEEKKAAKQAKKEAKRQAKNGVDEDLGTESDDDESVESEASDDPSAADPATSSDERGSTSEEFGSTPSPDVTPDPAPTDGPASSATSAAPSSPAAAGDRRGHREDADEGGAATPSGPARPDAEDSDVEETPALPPFPGFSSRHDQLGLVVLLSLVVAVGLGTAGFRTVLACRPVVEVGAHSQAASRARRAVRRRA